MISGKCPKCKLVGPISYFGWRNTLSRQGTRVRRIQSWCRACRARPNRVVEIAPDAS